MCLAAGVKVTKPKSFNYWKIFPPAAFHDVVNAFQSVGIYVFILYAFRLILEIPFVSMAQCEVIPMEVINPVTQQTKSVGYRNEHKRNIFIST